MQMLPKWRDNPQPVFISIKILGESAWPGQILAEFKASGQMYAVIVDKDLIDQVGNRMPAVIIADVGDNSYLVDLPGESPSAGSRVLVGTDDITAMEAANPG